MRYKYRLTTLKHTTKEELDYILLEYGSKFYHNENGKISFKKQDVELAISQIEKLYAVKNKSLRVSSLVALTVAMFCLAVTIFGNYILIPPK